jgi:hypothetical protein
MSLQPGTFQPLPSREELRAWVDEHKRHNADLTSYMWHIMPLADRFGDRAYDVAAKSLRASGLQVTAAQLRELAEELRTPAGRERYAEERRLHVMVHTTG